MNIVQTTLKYVTLTIFALLFLIPLYVLVVTSIKPIEEVSFLTMWDLPSSIDVTNMQRAFVALLPSLKNSFLMVIPASIISALIGSINGYALTKWKFKGADALFTFLFLGIFIPYQSILIPLINVLKTVGLYNTISGLVLVHVVYGIPMTTLMFRNFYVSVPQTLIEAAALDGAGFFKTYRHVIAPISITSFVVVGLWQFTNIWNEFLFAITITGTSKQPVMVALQNLAGSQIVEWNVQMAGALLAAIPTLLVYFVAGKYFIQGLLAGSVKE